MPAEVSLNAGTIPDTYATVGSVCERPFRGERVHSLVRHSNFAAVFLAVVFVFASPAFAETDKREDKDAENTQLYYAAKATFAEPKILELRLGGGYDLSNPYLNVFSAQGSAYFLASSEWAFGIEGTKYLSSKRSSTTALENELSAYAYTVKAFEPDYSVIGLVRVTPISGLVNFFSQRILQADISLVGRAGIIQYKTLNLGPVMGLALETHIGITPRFGVHSSIQWDLEKPGSYDWQWRSGFRIGPSFKF